jgi:hypothetical protein
VKRNIISTIGCIFLSFAIFAVSFSIQLKYSRWGAYVTDPRANQTFPIAQEHPEISNSLKAMLILTHVLILPCVSILVGCFAGFFATRPRIVALIGIIPFRLFYLWHDGGYILAIISTLVDIGIAVLAATLIARPKRLSRLAAVS